MVNHQLNILLHIADGVMVVGQSGKVLMANPAASQLFARPVDQMLSTDFGFPIVQGESSEIQIRHLAENRWITVEMRSASIHWDTHPAWLVSLRDITERKAIENQLRELNQINLAILNSLHASVAVLNTSGEIIRVNDMWQRFAKENGDPDEEKISVGANYFDICRASGDKYSLAALEGMEDILKSKRDGFDLLYPCHAPDEKRWFIMRVKPLKGDRISGLVVSHINVSSYYSRFREDETDKALLESISLDLLSYPTAENPIVPPIAESTIEAFSNTYQSILSDLVEQRTYKVDHQTTKRAESLAETLAIAWVHPRDLTTIHTNSLKRIYAKEKTHSMRQIYTEEGRMLLLQVLGYLAAHYRYYLRTNSPPE